MDDDAQADQQDEARENERELPSEVARRLLEPGRAVVLDTETTDLYGYMIEVAVLDAATGEILVNTKINPATPIQKGAQRVHGISDADLIGAPDLSLVLPVLQLTIGSRTIVTYNASFDFNTLHRHCARDGLEMGALGEFKRWVCLMQLRADWEHQERWSRLAGGNHRALGDCLAALTLLRTIAEGELEHDDDDIPY